MFFYQVGVSFPLTLTLSLGGERGGTNTSIVLNSYKDPRSFMWEALPRGEGLQI